MSKKIEKSDYLIAFSPDDSKWDIHRRQADKVSGFYNSSEKDHHQKYAERMHECADFLRFKFIDDGEESKLKLKRANFCRVRLCPICQWRRSMAWRAKMFELVPKVLKMNPSYKFIFLTLTIRNCEISELSETLKVMNGAFSKLIRRKEFIKSVKGFVRATEVTKGENSLAHPHFHCLLVVNKSYFTSASYISHRNWSLLWQECLKTPYMPIVDVRLIRDLDGKNNLEKAVLETLKYTVKIEDILSDSEWFLELSDQLHKKRFLSTGGILKNLLSDEVTDEEMLNPNEEDIEMDPSKTDLVFSWNKAVKHYVLER